MPQEYAWWTVIQQLLLHTHTQHTHAHTRRTKPPPQTCPYTCNIPQHTSARTLHTHRHVHTPPLFSPFVFLKMFSPSKNTLVSPQFETPSQEAFMCIMSSALPTSPILQREFYYKQAECLAHVCHLAPGHRSWQPLSISLDTY